LLVRSRRLRARRRKEWGRVEASAPNQIWQSDMTKIWAGPAVPPHPLAKLNPSPSHSCSLFALFPALPFFRINHLQPLFAKHPGWGVPNAYRTQRERLRHPSSTSPFRMNTCKSVSKQTTLTPFRMNTYAKPGGEGGPPFTSRPHTRANRPQGAFGESIGIFGVAHRPALRR